MFTHLNVARSTIAPELVQQVKILYHQAAINCVSLSCEAESYVTFGSSWNNEAKHRKMRTRLASQDEVSLLVMQNEASYTLFLAQH